jgi:hypothetical protein
MHRNAASSGIRSSVRVGQIGDAMAKSVTDELRFSAINSPVRLHASTQRVGPDLSLRALDETALKLRSCCFRGYYPSMERLGQQKRYVR